MRRLFHPPRLGVFYRRDNENTGRYKRPLVHRLERLGHQVTLEPLPEAA